MVVNGGELDGVRILSRESVEFMLSNYIQGYSTKTAAAPEPTTRSRTSRLWFSKLPAIHTPPRIKSSTGGVPVTLAD